MNLANLPFYPLVFATVIPPVFALVMALVSWRIPAHRRPPTAQRNVFLGWSTRLLSAISLISSILLASNPHHFPQYGSVFGVDLYLDELSLYFILLVNLVAFFASWYTLDFLRFDAETNPAHNPEYFHVFFNFFHLAMLIVPMVDNLIVLWMAIELTTLVSTMLVRYNRKRQAVEAAWKYIIITTTGIVFALLGTIFLTTAVKIDGCDNYNIGIFCQNLDLMNWSFLAGGGIASLLDKNIVRLSFLFILLGYGTKAGFAPMHTWLPDGHGEAPAPVSALLSGVLLKSALYAILRFYTITNLNQGSTVFTSSFLLFFGSLSLLIAAPFIIKPNRFKRVLAYHSLEHMGIIAFGIGLGGNLALFGALLHALNHALTKALMFITYGNISQIYAERMGSDTEGGFSITGALRAVQPYALVLVFGGLGLVGSPPFNIFMSEWIILSAGVGRVFNPPDQIWFWIYLPAVIIFVSSIAVIFAGLVAHLSRLLLDRPPFNPALPIKISFWQLLPLLILLVLITVFGVWIPSAPVDFRFLLERSVMILQSGVLPR